MEFTRITTSPDRMHGVPCIRDLRFPVATVVAMVADEMTTSEIVGEHPDLEPEDVAESLRYARGRGAEARTPSATAGVRLLLDQNLSPALVAMFDAAGHDAVHVRDLGLGTR
ncbi:MAG TPA: DUF5615 family PIN-like protein [Acidimicrobiales bacterium]|nr:DUF5615 family PIN-like protein [Acidimicrobiales bacterium]